MGIPFYMEKRPLPVLDDFADLFTLPAVLLGFLLLQGLGHLFQQRLELDRFEEIVEGPLLMPSTLVSTDP